MLCRRVLFVAVMCAVFCAAASAAQACTDTWVGTGTVSNSTGGSWGYPGNWSTGLVPGPGDDVCIGGSGVYTVSFEPYQVPWGSGPVVDGDSVRSLTVGGSSGSQTLWVAGESSDVGGTWEHETDLSVTNGITIGVTGEARDRRDGLEFAGPDCPRITGRYRDRERERGSDRQ